MRLDATDPFRVLPVPACASVGRWCSRFWLGPGQLCEREAKDPRQSARLPCPDLEWVRVLAFHVLARVVATDPETLVAIGPTMRPAAVVWAEWQRAPARPSGDALDYAGTFGRCPCGWTCDLCAAGSEAAPCRLDGRCYLAEAHVQQCMPDAVRWEGLTPWMRTSDRLRQAGAFPLTPATDRALRGRARTTLPRAAGEGGRTG